MLRLFAFAAVVALCACAAAYDPPVGGDHADPHYRAALAKCRKLADLNARRLADDSPQAAFRAAFQSSEPEHHEVLTCMQARGYKALATSPR